MNRISQMAQESITRSRIIQELIEWTGTKFRYGCEEKGKGVDCARMVMVGYKKVGFVPERFQPRHLPRDWFRFPEKFDKHEFRKDLLKFSYIIPTIDRKPADAIGFYINNMECHLGIVDVDTDFMYHAQPRHKVKRSRISDYTSISAVFRAKGFDG